MKNNCFNALYHCLSSGKSSFKNILFDMVKLCAIKITFNQGINAKKAYFQCPEHGGVSTYEPY